MKKSLYIYLVAGIIVVVVGAGAFYGGYVYGQQQKSSGMPNFANAGARFNRGQGGTAGQGMTRGGNSGGLTRGQIISKDAGTMTLKLDNGGSKIILFSTSTPVRKTVEDTINNVQVGQNIMVGGTANTDGSITAQSIQLVTNTTTPGGF